MYSQAKVIAGGLAHIPVVIAVFYFILTTFNKRALKFVEESKTKKPEAKAVDTKKVAVSKIEAPKTEAPKTEAPKITPGNPKIKICQATLMSLPKDL